MFKLAYTLEALPGGARDRYVTFRFRIENIGQTEIRVLSVTPIKSDDIEVKEVSTAEVDADSPLSIRRVAGSTVGAQTFVVEDTGGRDAGSDRTPLPAYRWLSPGETYETQFDVSFKRKWVNSYPCTFAVDAVIDDGPPPTPGDPDTDRLIHATASYLVAPLPTLLSIITVLGAVVGVVIRTALDYSDDSPLGGLFEGVLAPLIAATLIALVVFNAYEYLDVTDQAEASPSWRSAFFIGALCGLFSHQIMAALEAFIAPTG